MKILIYLTVFVSLFCLVPQTAFALETESNTVTTKVGEPPISSEGSATLLSIFEWDTKIVNALLPGLWNYINRLVTAFTNGSYSTGTWAGANEGSVYWCTYSIVDSYNLAGVSGLSKSNHAAVVNMRNFWKKAPSPYIYIDYPGSSTDLPLVKQGYAIFLEKVPGQYTGSEHVAMIKTVSVDARGNGYIETQDSNSSTALHKYPVDEWKIQGTHYPVRGFGGLEGQ